MSEKQTNLIKATGVVSIFTLLSRIMGLVRDMVVASFFGAGMSSDCFFVAFKIPNLLRRLVAEGSLSTAFVPIFSDELRASKTRAQDSLAAAIGFCLILTISLAALGMIFSEQVTFFFSPGFSSEPEKIDLATSLTRVMLPYIIFVSLTALLSAVLNCLGSFAIPAAAPIILNISMISAIVIAKYRLIQTSSATAILSYQDLVKYELTIAQEQWLIHILGLAVVAGGLLALPQQCIKLYQLGFKTIPKSPFRSPAVKSLVILMIPSILSSSLYQLMIFINTILASLLKEGSVSWLYYADRLFQFPIGVFSLSLATAILPTLSRFASEGKQLAVNKQATKSLNLITLVCIPATAGLYFLAEAITNAFYLRGSFDAESSRQTALALQAYALGLWGISLNSILVRVFLAKKNSKIPAYISGFSLILNIVFSMMLMGSAEVIPNSTIDAFFVRMTTIISIADFDHVGLALAGSIATYISVILLYSRLSKIETTIDLKSCAICLLKSLVACSAMIFVIKQTIALGFSDMLTVCLAVPLSAIVYGIFCFLLKIEETKEILKLLNRNK